MRYARRPLRPRRPFRASLVGARGCTEKSRTNLRRGSRSWHCLPWCRCGDERSHSRQQRPQNRLHNPLKHVVSTHIHNCAHTVGELRIRAKQVTRHTSNLKMRRVGVIMPVRRSHRRCRCRAARVQRAALEPEALAPAEVLANDVYIATHPAQIRRHRARRARLGARGLTRRSRARAPSRRGRRAA